MLDYITLWYFHIAIEYGPVEIVSFPSKKCSCSTAMLVYQKGIFWLVVWNIFYFSIYYWEESSHSTFICFNGVGIGELVFVSYAAQHDGKPVAPVQPSFIIAMTNQFLFAPTSCPKMIISRTAQGRDSK